MLSDTNAPVRSMVAKRDVSLFCGGGEWGVITLIAPISASKSM